MHSENTSPPTAPCAGAVVLLYDIVPTLSTMLTHALRLSGYVPIEVVQQQVLLGWLRVHPPELIPVAVICDMATPADPAFLRQVVAAARPLTVLGIADRKGTERARIWEEWVPLSLPRSFRVHMLLNILHGQQTAAPQGRAG